MKALGPRCLQNYLWAVALVIITASSLTESFAATRFSSPTSAAQILVNPSSLSFGTVVAGNASSQAATLTNNSSGAMSITQINVPLGFTVSGLATNSSLAPGQSVGFSVVFAPAAAGTFSGSISITASANAKRGKRYTSSASIAVSGTGSGQGLLAPSPSSVNFGSVTTSTTSTQSVQITNSGGSTTTISQVAASGTGFSVGAVALPMNLPPGQSANFSVKFSPSSAGTKTGSLNISSNASDPSLSVALAGSGVSPATLSASPLSVAFGSVTTSTTATQAVQITNTGGSSGTISQVSVTGAGFAVTQPGLPLTLAAGQSVSLNLTFTPTVVGTATGSLTVSSNASNPSLSVGLTGSGVTPAALTVSPTSVSFGNVQVGTSQTQNALVSNTGGSSASISQAAVTGSGFSVSGLNTPFTLAAGQSASFSITFAPTTTGTSTGSVTLSSTASVPPIALSGSGISAAGQLTANPTSLNFGTVVVGSSSSQNVTVTAGTGSVTISQANVSGAGFAVSGLSLPLTLSAGQSITFSASFAPSTTGATSGSVSLVSNASNTPTTVALSGTGGTAATTQLTASPTSLSFGSVTVGSSSSQNVSVTASGGSVTISQVNTTGAAFSVSGPTLPLTLAAGQSTNLSVTFAPTTSGTASGTVSVVSNASNTPTSVSLSGVGAVAQTSSSAPVLFFSDLDWGPKTGWEGSTSRGAAVTVWGKNFGTTRGTSYITINGAQLTSDSSYAEWDAIGPARGLERITFWIPSTALDGTGTISVTVNGTTSNTLPFLVAAGTIYFIAPTGSNSNTGLFSTNQGGTNGPFRDIFMFNPGQDGFHSAGSRNPSGDGQYIVYVRGGTYSTLDPAGDSAMLSLRGPYGNSTKRKALIGYPGETPVLDTTNATRGFVWPADYDPYGFEDYFTYSKLYATNGTFAIGVFGSYTRVVGCTFKDYLANVWTGVVMVEDSKNTSILGNLFDHNGYDSYKHNIYIKTQPSISGVDISTLNTNVGWDEFSNAVASDAHGGVIFVSRASNAGTYITDGVQVHDSYFHDGNDDFIYVGDSTPIGNVYVYDNLFKGGTSINGGLTFYNGTSNAYVYNNTFYQIGPSSLPMIWGTGTAQLQFKNNIWYSSPGQPFFKLESWQGATAGFDHDLFFNPGGTTSIPSGGGITVTGSITGDPLFQNAGGGDYRLQSGSPAIDAGVGTVAPTVVRDFVGRPRPQGSAYDIGAFEF